MKTSRLAYILIFATLTSINRYVALTVVRQSLAAGNTDGLQWFLPYTWPSIMLAGSVCLAIAIPLAFLSVYLAYAIWILFAPMASWWSHRKHEMTVVQENNFD
jgi:hypothetical protein